MKKSNKLPMILTIVACALAVLLLVLYLTSPKSAGSGPSAGAAKLEYAYSQAVTGSKLDMDNYNGMDLAGIEMFRYSSFTFDTYSDNTYVLKTGTGFAINTLNGSMGGSTATYIGTFTVEPVYEGSDNTEFIYKLSVPTRVINARDISYMGSSLVDTDNSATYPEEDAGNTAAQEVLAQLRDGQYYSEITVDREFCTITDAVMSEAK